MIEYWVSDCVLDMGLECRNKIGVLVKIISEVGSGKVTHISDASLTLRIVSVASANGRR